MSKITVEKLKIIDEKEGCNEAELSWHEVIAKCN